MKYNKTLLTFFVCICSMQALGQKFIEKPFNTWGRDDAIKLVTDSPWAEQYQSTAAAAAAEAAQVAREQGQAVGRGGSNPGSVGRQAAPPPVTMRLHSGLPLRQAIVRLQQIDVGYDKMSDADKAAFDNNRKGYLECRICKDYYVLTLVKATDKSRSTVEEGIFQGFSAADLKGNVKLVNDRGEERELVEFNAPKNAQDAAVFYFKRTDQNGKPLLTPESKEFKLVFDTGFLTTANRFAYLLPRTFAFKVSKLVVGNELLF